MSCRPLRSQTLTLVQSPTATMYSESSNRSNAAPSMVTPATIVVIACKSFASRSLTVLSREAVIRVEPLELLKKCEMVQMNGSLDRGYANYLRHSDATAARCTSSLVTHFLLKVFQRRTVPSTPPLQNDRLGGIELPCTDRAKGLNNKVVIGPSWPRNA